MKIKRLCAGFLSALMILTGIPTNVFDGLAVAHADEVTIVASGECSATDEDDVHWSLDSEGTFTISGTGDMEDRSWSYTGLGSYRFSGYYDYTVTKVVIEEGVTKIGKIVFYNNDSIKEVTISNTVTDIAGDAFGNYTSLEKLTIGDSVTYIGQGAFSDCSSLEEVTLPKSLITLDKGAFANCKSLKKVNFNDKLTTIGGYAFYECSSLEEVIMPDSVTTIDNEETFLGCTSLKKLKLSNSLTKIPLYTFTNCDSLEEVTIPNSVTTLVSGCFSDCDSLKKVTIPSSVIDFDPYPPNPFYNCSSLEAIYGESGSVAQTFAEQYNFPFIPLSASSRTDATTSTMSLKIKQNKNYSTVSTDNYVLSNNAEITYGDDTYTTGVNGVAKVPYISSGEITISKENYVSRTLTAEQLSSYEVINLQKKNSNCPVISGVWINNVDVLNNKYYITSADKVAQKITLEIDWQGSTCDTAYICQGSKKITFNNNSLMTTLKDDFDTSQPIYVVAKNKFGITTKRKLKFATSTSSTTTSTIDNDISDITASLKDGFSVELGDDVQPFFLANSTISMGVNDLIPYEVVAEDGKIYVALGLDLGGVSGEDGSTEVKNYVKELKNGNFVNADDASEAVEGLLDFKNKYKDILKPHEGSFAFDCDCSVFGYIEGTYDEEGNVTLGGGLIINPTIDVSYSYPFVFYGVPMYVKAELEADIEASLKIEENLRTKKVCTSGEITGDIAASLGIGVGLDGIAYVEGGGTATYTPDFNISSNGDKSFSLMVAFNLYVKAGILGFEYEKDFINAEAMVYEWSNNSHSGGGRAFSAGDYSDIYDTDNYETQDLSYLEETSEEYFKSYDSSVESSDSENINTLKTNIYKNSTPKIVTLSDGKKVAVWMDSDSSNVNNIYLYYSVYENDTWSDPKIVYEDNTMDNEPELVVLNDKVYLAWQNATKSFDNTEELGINDITPYFDVAVATLDAENNTFETKTISYDNLDQNPTLCANGDDVYVAWTNNSENAWFGNNDNNSIVYSKLTDGSWSDPEKLYDSLNSVGNLTIDYNESLNVAYAMDTDNDLSTTDDIRVYENGEQVSGDTASSKPSYSDHTLYWYANNNIVNKDTSDEEGSINANTYQILDVNGNKAIIYTVSNGLTNTLMMAYYNDETSSWGEGKAITDGTSYIGSFSGTVSESGLVSILINNEEVVGTYGDENIYGESSLALVNANAYTDISIENVFYSKDSYCAGSCMPFTVDYTNNGTEIVNGVNIYIKDKSGNTLSSYKYSDKIVPGETLEKIVSFAVKDDATGQDIVILVEPMSATDVNTDDNSKELQLSYEKSFVENLSFGYMEDGKTCINTDIVNRGYTTQTGLTVSIYKDSTDGTPIETQTIDSLDALDIYTASFVVDSEPNDVFYVVLNNGDNVEDSDFIPIYNEIQDNEGHIWDEGTVTKEATCTEAGVMTYTCTECEETKTEEIPALGHDFAEEYTIDKAATTTEEGSKSRHCSRCEEVTDVTTIDKLVSGWNKTDDGWVYIDITTGELTVGWKSISSKWYYFGTDGVMVTGWKQISSKWYYFNGSGAMVKGWQQINNKWYYFSTSGVMKTGWAKISNKWYYFDKTGYMITGWKKINGTWYYFNSNGSMTTGWKKLNNKWYYFESDGKMISSTTITISGKSYTFDENGVMAE